jgi:TRAP-type C4-dicarboxylate transport system substrate-binding protein
MCIRRRLSSSRNGFSSASRRKIKASRAYLDRVEKSGLEELRQRGMKVVEDIDRSAFAVSLASLEGEFQKQFGKDKIDAIRTFGK